MIWKDKPGENMKVIRIQKAKKELTAYFIATLCVSWIVCLPAVIFSLQGNTAFNFLVKVNTYVPSFVALFFLFKFSGKKQTFSALRRIVRVRFNVRWYLFIFLLIPGLLFGAYLISWLLSGATFQSVLLPVIQEQPFSVFFIFAYLMFFEGPFGEEFGWRGFALPKMLNLSTPIKASLILGFIWSLWHLPSFFITGAIQYELAQNGFFLAFLIYFVYTLILTLFMTILHIKTNGSVFAAILFHTVANFSHGLITIITQPLSAMIFVVLLMVCACVFVWVYRRTFFSKKSVGVE